MTDTLEQLFAFKWRNVEIPITRMRMSIAHDLVEHKYWGVDGARIESTGLEPIRIHATIPLQNGMVPGRSESWSSDSPYPTLMRSLILAFSKREKGDLQHPEFGILICKADKLDIDWDAMKRGGCDAEASWIVTTDDDAAAVASPSPVTDTGDASRSLDSDNDELYALIPQAPVFSEDWSAAFNKITGAFDQVTLAANKFKAPIDRFLYRTQQLQDAVERARTALGWPIIHHAERIKSSVADIRKQLVEAGREIGLFLVPADTTLAGVSLQLPDSNLTDIIRLNPDLMRKPTVKAGTIVRYFGARLAA